jgi:hypothetical protein
MGARSYSRTVVTFEVRAEDDVDGTATLEEDNTLTQDDDVGGDITISCDPPSGGTTFPVGSTDVDFVLLQTKLVILQQLHLW